MSSDVINGGGDKSRHRRHSVSGGSSSSETKHKHRMSSRLKQSVTDLFTPPQQQQPRTDTSSGDEGTPRSFRMDPVPHRTDELLQEEDQTSLLASFPPCPVPKLHLTTEGEDSVGWREARQPTPTSSQPTTPTRSRSNTINSHALLAEENRRHHIQLIDLEARVRLLEQEQSALFKQHMGLQRIGWTQQQRSEQPTSLCDDWCVLW